MPRPRRELREGGAYTHLYKTSMPDTVIEWMETTLEDLRAFPPEARQAAGYELYRVQVGSMPTDWKPMPSVGPGVNEIRIRTRLEHRVLYLARFDEAIYVLHVFEKKSRKTRKADLILARQRLWRARALSLARKER